MWCKSTCGAVVIIHKMKGVKNMKSIYQPKVQALGGVYESQQKRVAQKIDELSITLRDRSTWALELGDHLVYLKYFLSSSHNTEMQIWAHLAASSGTAHKKEHDAIIHSINGLLAKIHGSGDALSLCAADCTTLITTLKRHNSQHDSELRAAIEKQNPQQTISRQVVSVSSRRTPAWSLGYCAA